MIGKSIEQDVDAHISNYEKSRLANLVGVTGCYAIKFVQSRWAINYSKPSPLKISTTPALTWGTATYVTPLAFPLSSALYGRIGLVCEFDAKDWRVFDATDPTARMAYVNWVRAQPAFFDLAFTVHSTHANHYLRNRFREDFHIDCVLFHPDQEAELHTDRGQHLWMAVTDWTSPASKAGIECGLSARLARARFTVLLDEDFALETNGLPVMLSMRQIERVTQAFSNYKPVEVGQARTSSGLWSEILQMFNSNGYLHVYIRP